MKKSNIQTIAIFGTVILGLSGCVPSEETPNNYVDEAQNPVSSSSGTIVSSVTGRTWMDKNVGATRACQNQTDKECYGDYYQWGRQSDGHQRETSSVYFYSGGTYGESDDPIVNTIYPNIDSFISNNNNLDWTFADPYGSSRSSNWDICPSGFRVPTSYELLAEQIYTSNDAWNRLKLPFSKSRNRETGVISEQHESGSIWSTTPLRSNEYSSSDLTDYEDFSWTLYYSSTYSERLSWIGGRAYAKAVRCIKN